MKKILAALKDVLLSYGPARSFVEAMIKFDFKIGEAHTNLMQICFSNLASWPLIPLLFLIFFDPFKFSWSLVGLLSFDNPVVFFLLDGRLAGMLIFFVLFFVMEWVIRKEYLLIGLIFYFLNRNELHIHLATVALLAVYVSRICYLWWLSVDSESETKKIWKSISQLQFAAWVLVSFSAIGALDYLQINHLFSQSGEMTRFGFLGVTVLLYHGFSHLFLSLWGHFYFQRTTEPSQLSTFYSTANWILRFNMSNYLRSLLKARIPQQLEKHLESELQYVELKKLNPALANFSVGPVLGREISFLKEAGLRLSKIG